MERESRDKDESADDTDEFNDPGEISSDTLRKYYDAISSDERINIKLSELDDLIGAISFLQNAVIELEAEVRGIGKSSKKIPLKTDFDDSMNNSFRTLNEMSRQLIERVARGER